MPRAPEPWDRDALPALPSFLNFRDAGGIDAGNGQRVRRRVLLRSEVPSGLTAGDRSALEALDIALAIDLRTDRERGQRRAEHHAVARVLTIPLHEDPRWDVGLGHLARFLTAREGERVFRAHVGAYYRHLVSDRAAPIGAALRAIADTEGAPCWLHCRAGRDRTGVLVAILHALLGVPDAHVLAHFAESDRAFGARLARLTVVLRALTLLQVPRGRIRTVLTTQPDVLAEILDELRARHGSIEGYLRERCGLEAATVATLRASLLELA